MKKLLIVAAVSALFAVSAFAGNDHNTVASAGGFTNVNVTNNINGSVTAVNGGFSQSQATNSQAATGSITTSVFNGKTSISGQNVPTTTSGVSGVVGTQSSSTAWNYSTGNANGDANSMGGAGAVVGGGSKIGETASGSGYAGVGHTDAVNADTNQGGYTGSVTSANFGSTQTYDHITTGSSNDNGKTSTASVGVSSVLTGGSTVSNASGIMTVNGTALNAPENSFVGDSGTFTAVGNASAGTGVGVSIGNANTND